ncbi:MAG: hypothetical protein K8L99_31325 [Anaerolineae bacterium]|nr:hypothetical protein [Anaerolineae bacterium]
MNEDSEREINLYRRLYQVCHTALLAIATYDAGGGRGIESYARDQGIPVERYKDISKSDWEYLRRVDYEVANSALQRVNEIVQMMKGK